MKRLQKMEGWSDLQKDIVRLIMEKLCWSERVRLCMTICKSWQIPIHELDQIRTGIDMFPWLICFNWNHSCHKSDSVCNLFDPVMEKCYSVDIQNTLMTKLVVCKWNNTVVGASPCASSYGWVLFAYKEMVNDPKISFFLYSPFTNEAIDLPDLEVHWRQTIAGVSFSLSSSSPDCFVFVLLLEDFTGRLIIKMCKPGDEAWRMKELDGTYNRPMSVLYANESFYCLYHDGKLFTFNIKLQEWKLLVNETQGWEDDFRLKLILSSTGDILVTTRQQRFYRLYLLEKQWIEVGNETMKQDVIFLGRTSFSVPALGKASKFAGTINNCFNQQQMVPDCYNGYTALLKRQNLSRFQASIWVEPGIWRACDLVHSCFMNELKYASSHEWVKHEGLVATIGITHLAKDRLGEAVSIDLPEPGGSVIQGRGFGTVESVKGISHDIRSPTSGQVVKVNSELIESPDLINSSPYKEGWMIKVRLSNPSELESLMVWNEYTRKNCKDRSQVPDGKNKTKNQS